MNNRGQTLVLFILLLPIFLLILILVIDVSNIALCNIKLKNISKIATNYGLDNILEFDSNSIYDIINKNDKDIDASVSLDNGIINLQVSKNVIGIINRGKVYKVIVCYQGYLELDKKVIRGDNCES